MGGETFDNQWLLLFGAIVLVVLIWVAAFKFYKSKPHKSRELKGADQFGITKTEKAWSQRGELIFRMVKRWTILFCK
jgi:hypothetical protein